MKNNSLPSNSAFWRDLESRFTAIPDASRLQAVLVDTGWYLSGGPGGRRENDYVKERFTALAQSAGYALGTPNGASALNIWLERLRQKSSSFCLITTEASRDSRLDFQGGYIGKVVAASAEYCALLESEAFANETREHEIELTEASIRESRAKRRTSVIDPLLKAKGWRPGTWAVKAGVSPAIVYAYLDGTTKALSERSRPDLAQALGIREEDLPE